MIDDCLTKLDEFDEDTLKLVVSVNDVKTENAKKTVLSTRM